MKQTYLFASIIYAPGAETESAMNAGNNYMVTARGPEDEETEEEGEAEEE